MRNLTLAVATAGGLLRPFAEPTLRCSRLLIALGGSQGAIGGLVIHRCAARAGGSAQRT